MKIAFIMAFVLVAGLQESQGVIMTSGKIALGVDTSGELNVVPIGSEVSSINGTSFGVGLSYSWSQAELDAVGTPERTPGFYDSTTPACYCEGWGVSGTQGSTTGSGYVNGFWNSGAAINLASVSLVSNESAAGAGDATTITSIASIGAVDHVDLRVTQVYEIAPQTPTIWRDHVTITNTSATDTISNVKYVRVMDWDVPQTDTGSPLEFTTVTGVGTTAFLERSHDGGFSSSNPLSVDTAFGGGLGANKNTPLHAESSVLNMDFDIGPSDQGAYFRFNFGSLAPLASKEFFVFYGAAPTKFDMLAGLQLVGTELYSLGQSNIATRDIAPTYAFAFKDVGGIEVVHVIPEPGTLALLGIGLAGLGYFGRKRIIKKK